ncbi:hypothetical protein DNHGIG_34800 [Collibacillus ludicampi]|jgi:hypothetical protein|uniref:Small, acid-soluble spore protein K n=1 Tax=Collibacillus ludicampi TaxID=2771369 RepID=A0AAV4LJK5_9BACL|nr:hypothetical protein [Collibacillus ludicampi]GIM47931.1 hypothetical protein DNHGIG_34800 [Collibacillus ludicampi]
MKENIRRFPKTEDARQLTARSRTNRENESRTRIDPEKGPENK